MRSKGLRITKLLALTAVLLAMLLVFGCKKKTGDEPSTPPAQSGQIEQTTCPVMDGNPIDKNVFVEYKGKRVYFCCADCKAEFEADPEKYLDKLPQFKQELQQKAQEAADKAAEEMEKTSEKIPELQ